MRKKIVFNVSKRNRCGLWRDMRYGFSLLTNFHLFEDYYTFEDHEGHRVRYEMARLGRSVDDVMICWIDSITRANLQ